MTSDGSASRSSPEGGPKAPGRLELLQRLINSYNHDFPREWDRLGTPEKALAWLRPMITRLGIDFRY